MKKVVFCLALFMFLPLFVRAANLTVGINVDGIGDLGLTRNVYNLTIFTKQDYETITVTAADGANVTMTVDGNAVTGNQVPVQEGMNVVKITVSNGTMTEEWTINLTIDKTTEYDSENPSTGAFMPILEITAIVLLGGAMYWFSRKKILKRI